MAIRHHGSDRHLEIERKYLLRAVPVLPADVEVWRIEQGYVPGARLRSIATEDGAVRYFKTVKSGRGLVRTEIETELPEPEFCGLWPKTAGHRLKKTRYRVHQAAAIWEVDVFDGVDLVMAEIELERADAAVEIPPWLASVLDREVTNDPAYSNFKIASRLGGSPG